jgi:RNA polymerase sigma factor (sigma-70 family)
MERMKKGCDRGAPASPLTAGQLEAFYAAEYPKLVKLLMLIFGASMEEAEDAAQKAMMDFAQRCGSAVARIHNPAGYVRRAATHFFVKERQRDRERLPHEIRGGYLVADAQPDRELTALEDGQYVERLLELVTPIQRDVLRLVMEGLSTREIAGQLHKSDENIRQHLKNGRDRIRLHPDLARLTSRKSGKREA